MVRKKNRQHINLNFQLVSNDDAFHCLMYGTMRKKSKIQKKKKHKIKHFHDDEINNLCEKFIFYSVKCKFSMYYFFFSFYCINIIFMKIF